MPKEKNISVSNLATPIRLDIFLTEKLGLSRSKVQAMIASQGVLVNGKLPKKAGSKISGGDTIKLNPLASTKLPMSAGRVAPAFPKIAVVAETPDYIIINKPAGLLAHETEAHEEVTLARWLLKRYPKLQGIGEYDNRPGIVHRLDKEASGLMVIAKTQAMFDSLKNQFQKRTVEKEYTVLVHGKVPVEHGVIDFPIDRGLSGRMVARPKTDRLKVSHVRHRMPGKASLTEFFVSKIFARFTQLRVQIHTGRTHQIRVHMFAYGHPVVGDELYMNKKLGLKRDQALGRLFLHATRLCFNDLAGGRQCYSAALPQELISFLNDLH